jgi:DNA polymerase III epsilon subunit-like protein
MKYISIDIETTGLDPETCNVLSIGAIVEDAANPLPYDKCPKFHVAIVREQLTGSPFAINLNKSLIESIAMWKEYPKQREAIESETGMQFLHPEDVVEAFYDFLYENGFVEFDRTDINRKVKVKNGKPYPMLTSNMKAASITAAGKNFATFDKLFLEKLPRWKQCIRLKQRVLDPSILFINWIEDTDVPNLLTCKQRADISGEVTHNALEDAWDVIAVLRKKY